MIQNNHHFASLSVIVPALNEENIIATNIKIIRDFLHKNATCYEIIVVNDGSSDATASICQKLLVDIPQLRLISLQKNFGKGLAVRTGMAASIYAHIVFLDADLSTPIEETLCAKKKIDEGYDIVIGSRAMKNSKIIKRQPLLRQTMGKVFNLIVRILFKIPWPDTQCGFKFFSRAAAHKLAKHLTLNRFSFDVELIFLAQKFKYKISEIPVRWLNREESKVKIFSGSLEMFFALFTILKNEQKGKYSF